MDSPKITLSNKSIVKIFIKVFALFINQYTMEIFKNTGLDSLAISAFASGINILVNNFDQWHVGAILIGAGVLISTVKYFTRA